MAKLNLNKKSQKNITEEVAVDQTTETSEGNEETVVEAEKLTDLDYDRGPDGKPAVKTVKPIAKGDEENKSTIKAKPSNATAQPVPDKKNFSSEPFSKFVIAKEDIQKLFGADELSEEFLTKASALFEAAVNEKIDELAGKLQESFDTKIEEFTTAMVEELGESVDQYVEFVGQTYIAENALAIDSGLRAELSENFLSKLKTLFDDCYVTMPESKVDVVESITAANADLQKDVATLIEQVNALKDELETTKATEMLREACDGLTDLEAARLCSLAEKLSFDNLKEFGSKLQYIKESTISGIKRSSTASQNLSEDYTGDDLQESDEADTTRIDSAVKNYLTALTPKTKSA